MLVLLDASIENVGYSWIKRIFRSPQSFQYPVRHILLMELMAGSTRSFFREECPEFGSDAAKCYAVKSDFLTAENARFTTWKAKPSDYGSHPAMSGTEARTRYRRRWLELMEQRPDAIRSGLIEMAPSCYAWLRKNDFEWYNSHSPPAKYGNFDWAEKDRRTLGELRTAYERLVSGDGKPRRITKSALINESGTCSIFRKHALNKMPKTSSFLNAVLESWESWRKRKIIWAVHELAKNERRPTFMGVMSKASVPRKYLEALTPFIMEQLSKLWSER